MRRTPELRFQGFSEKWKMKKLGELGSFKNGLNKAADDFGYGKPFVNLMDVFGTSVVNADELGLVNVNEKELEDYNLLKGDVLFIRSSVKPTGVGLTALIKDDMKETVYSGFLIRFRDENNFLNLNYKRYCFATPDIRNQIMKKASVSANTNINQESLSAIKLLIPSKEEQQKIADFFSTLDTRIEIQEQKIKNLEYQKKGYMQRIFSQDIRFMNENGEDYPEWEEKTLGEIADITMGQSPSSDNYNSEEIGLPLIQGNADIVNNSTNPSYYTSEVTKTCDIGDIILTVRAPVGEVAKSKHLACLGRGVCSLKVKCSLGYVYNYLLFNKIKWNRLAQGSTFTAINGNDIKKFKIEIPKNLNEQEEIANFLSLFDEKIEIEKRILETLQEMKKGFLQKMFV